MPSDFTDSNAWRFRMARAVLRIPGLDVAWGKALRNPSVEISTLRTIRSRRHACTSGLALLGLVATLASAQRIDGKHAERAWREV